MISQECSIDPELLPTSGSLSLSSNWKPVQVSSFIISFSHSSTRYLKNANALALSYLAVILQFH